jgi:hypothetical protein
LGFANPAGTAHLIGTLEIVCAFLLLFKPFRKLVLLLFIWKMVSELFYPAHEVLEWVERGGSYGILLGLWLALEQVHSNKEVYQTSPV